MSTSGLIFYIHSHKGMADCLSDMSISTNFHNSKFCIRQTRCMEKITQYSDDENVGQC